MWHSSFDSSSTMTPMSLSLAFVLLLSSIQLASPTTLPIVFLERWNTYHEDPETLQVKTGPAQHCYSFDCYTKLIKYANWRDLQTHSRLAFYAKPNCQGKEIQTISMVEGRGTGSATLDVFPSKSRVNSIMILESGSYATRGITRLCRGMYERIGNGTGGSSSSSSEGTIGS